MPDESSADFTRLPREPMRHRDAIKAALGLLFLNAMLSFSLWWPTPGIRPALRLAPEFVLFWVLLLVAVRVAGTLSRRWLAAFAIGYLLLAIGRYADVAAPALFGREVNLYWDAPHALRFVRVSAQSAPAWLVPGSRWPCCCCSPLCIGCCAVPSRSSRVLQRRRRCNHLPR